MLMFKISLSSMKDYTTMKSVELFSVLFLGVAIAIVQWQLRTPPSLRTSGTPTDSQPTETLDPTTVESTNDLPWPEECDEELCKLPDCRCSSTNIPGGLSPRDTPQFVTITFDDGINIQNIVTYHDNLYNRFNSNGCPAGATFYVSHEYTNYSLVNELYNRGFEIALHSITHKLPVTYWSEATAEDMRREFGDQKLQMSHLANIPYNSIKGLRIPFIRMTGNASFAIMKEYSLEYDCTMATINFTNPGLWPYTLDYASTQDCVIPPCPSASFPGLWVMPLLSWYDLEGRRCMFVDNCINSPERSNEDEWYEFILANFERHYLGNRAPFGFYVHEVFLNAFPAVHRAYLRFMDMINKLPDVFIVNTIEVLDWVRKPIPLDEYKRQNCRTFTPTICDPRTCPFRASHKNSQDEPWLQICKVCPRVYPWLNNPFGQ